MEKKVWEHARALYRNGRDRVNLMKEMERTYLLQWNPAFASKQGEDPPPWITEVKDPQPFMAVRWLTSIMATSDPRIGLRIPQEALSIAPEQKFDNFKQTMLHLLPQWVARLFRTSDDTEQLTESLEQILDTFFRQNDARARTPLLSDMLHSAFVHGRIVVKVADLRHNDDWAELHADESNLSPFIMRVRDAKNVFVEWDYLGLHTVLERSVRTRRDIEDEYGVDLSDLCDEPTQNLIFNEYWTRQVRHLWVEKVLNEGEEIADTDYAESVREIDGEHSENTLRFIPYVVADAYATAAFGERDMTYPLLYPGYQSQLFQRTSLFFTVVTSLAFRLANPQWAQIGVPEGEEAIDLDFTQPNVYPMGPGQTLQDMNTKLNSDLYQVLETLMAKAQDATVSPVTAGQLPTGVRAASALGLLAQGGKLQLLPVQNCVELMYAQIINLIFKYIRLYDEIDEDAATIDLWTAKGLQRLDPGTLPDYIEPKVSITIQLPQDKAAQINTALNAWKSRAISQRTMWEWMDIPDTNEELRRMQWEEARGLAPALNAYNESMQQPAGLSTQEGVPVEQTPAQNPVSQMPSDIQQDVGGGAR